MASVHQEIANRARKILLILSPPSSIPVPCPQPWALPPPRRHAARQAGVLALSSLDIGTRCGLGQPALRWQWPQAPTQNADWKSNFTSRAGSCNACLPYGIYQEFSAAGAVVAVRFRLCHRYQPDSLSPAAQSRRSLSFRGGLEQPAAHVAQGYHQGLRG